MFLPSVYNDILKCRSAPSRSELHCNQSLSYRPQMSLYEYIKDLSTTIQREKSAKLLSLLTISPGQDIGLKRAHYEDPSDIDLYVLPDKFHAVVRAYLKLMRTIYIHSDLRSSFSNANDLLLCLNRAAESQTNWVCPALINCSEELISIYQVLVNKYPEDAKHATRPSESGVEIQQDTPLEIVANNINKSFKICLTDKSANMKLSKKQSIHFFLAALLKLYFKLDKLQLAKSIEKALVATGYISPSPGSTPVQYRKHSVTYLYYSALLSLNDSDFIAAEKKLDTAMDLLAYCENVLSVRNQTEKILMLLIPLKMNNSRTNLTEKTWESYPSLKYVFRDRLFKAIKAGDLKSFDHWTRKFQKIFLKRYIYVLILNLRSLCTLRLFERAHTVHGEINSTSPHIVPFGTFQAALNISGMPFELPPWSSNPLSIVKLLEDEYGEVECLLATFILKRLIKGYLSHSNKCIVFSKVDPFPRT